MLELIAAHNSKNHEHKQCISRAKTRFNVRLGEMGKTLGINDKPVLHLLLSNHRAFSAYDIADILSKVRKRIQPIQIYRSLEKLMVLRAVHRLYTKNKFVACYKEGNCRAEQFLICDKCNNVQEIDSELLEKEIQNLAQKNNFLISSKSVEVQGLCNNCK